MARDKTVTCPTCNSVLELGLVDNEKLIVKNVTVSEQPEKSPKKVEEKSDSIVTFLAGGIGIDEGNEEND